MKNNFKIRRGITLISLVITIVVLLILAGVAINLAVDSDGLFKKAGDAANKWNDKVAEERTELQNLLAIVDGIGKLTSIEIKATNMPLATIGATGTLEALVSDEETLTWTIEDTEVATLSETEGKIVTVTAVAEGYTNVIVSNGEIEGKYCVAVGENVILISSASDLKAFRDNVNNGNQYLEKAVVMISNIDLKNELWEPIGQTDTVDGEHVAGDFQGTFDGNGYTISNLKIEGPEDDGDYGVGLFGFIDADPDGAVIKNLNIDGATVTGYHWTGVIVGYLTGTVENCTVKNATVYAKHINDDTACGDKIGGICGFINGGAFGLINGCRVEDSTITAGRDAGIIVGGAIPTQVSDNSFENVIIQASGDCPREANINEAVIGRAF